MTDGFAPGWPGITPRWTSSAKSGVGTSPWAVSRVWFTLSHGILDQIYYPDVDFACTRDMGLVVTDGSNFFSEEKRHATHEIETLARGVPAYRLTNTCVHGRYRVEKRVLTSMRHDAVLQQTAFTPLVGALADYHVCVLLAPHLANRGAGNTAWVGEYKGVPVLCAERDGHALALACSAPWLARSAGFAGTSDGWQDLWVHKRITWQYARAENGNVALTGEVDLAACGGEFLLAVGFGSDATKAAYQAVASVQEGFEHARGQYVRGWQTWQRSLSLKDADLPGDAEIRRAGATVLRVHESKNFASGIIASLSIPWGFSKGDDDLGGYHLVWPRDLVEAAGGLLAIGATADAHRVLRYLAVTQESDGRWPQNMWLDGTPYWHAVQMDETAFPILLVNILQREEALSAEELAEMWPMVRRAAGFIVRNGPATAQDRWEENAGLTPFTLAAEIAALVAAADVAELHGAADLARYLRETADEWNDDIERWTYATGTEEAQALGIEGYYVRIAPADSGAASPHQGFVPIRLSGAMAREGAAHTVSPDALALVRFGLRASDDPRILNTIRAIDAALKRALPYGPGWRRYNGDRYGEYDDGRPYDGDGVGRCWPLLTGERAHYELAAGRKRSALALLRVMEQSASSGGMIPEQVWDGASIPRAELEPGRPAGSAMPLVWAHAEHLKLCRSLADGRVFDMPPQTAQRYLVQHTTSEIATWKFNLMRRAMLAGRTLRIALLAAAQVHWTADDWATSADAVTRDTGLGTQVCDLPTRALPAGSTVSFTFRWNEGGQWEGENFDVRVE